MGVEIFFNPWLVAILVLGVLAVIIWILFGGPGESDSACDTCDDDDGALFICGNTLADSQCNRGVTRIRSQDHENPTAQIITTRDPETTEFMVHEPAGAPTALVVLIAGGQLNAGINTSAADPLASVTSNFLVRSAHLFAQQGFRAVTVDRPSDWQSYLTGVGNQGWRLDPYRVHVNHCIDLSQVITATNAEDLPVVLAGTSRGAISAFRWQKMAHAISLSSSLTLGNGFPIGSSSPIAALRPAALEKPACVHWSPCDGCSVTTPADSQALLNELSALGIPGTNGGGIGGGYRGANPDPCSALTWHGFLGIESCAVQTISNCLNDALGALQLTAAIKASPYVHPAKVISGARAEFSLRDQVRSHADRSIRLKYSLPTDQTSLSLRENVTVTEDGEVMYTAPSLEKPATDRFVYVATSQHGGVTHNVASIDIVPR